MSVSLSKGQKLNLSKQQQGLSKVMVGLGWDEAGSDSKGGLFRLFKSKASPIDCDASAILCGHNGKALSGEKYETCVFYGHLEHSSGAIVHQGDNLTGEGDGDDEQIMVDLNRVPDSIAKIVFVVNIYQAKTRNQHFGMIKNAYIRLVNLSDNTEICKYDLSDNYNGMTGLIVGEVINESGEWSLNAIGEPIKDASNIEDIIKMYI